MERPGQGEVMRAQRLRLVGAAAATLAAVVLVVNLGAQAPKGLDGTWKLNVAKSRFSPGPAPKSMTLTYTYPPSGDEVKIVVQQVMADGATQKWEMTPKYDGKDYPVTGNPDADAIALGKLDGLKSHSTFKRGGKVASENVRTLSGDGKTLTIETKGTNAKGQAVHNIQVFER
jgi:hypothetical protein